MAHPQGQGQDAVPPGRDRRGPVRPRDGRMASRIPVRLCGVLPPGDGGLRGRGPTGHPPGPVGRGDEEDRDAFWPDVASPESKGGKSRPALNGLEEAEAPSRVAMNTWAG